MSRIMRDKHNNQWTVVEHIILKNFWEYYIIEDFDDDGIGYAYVMGIENEFGSVYLPEMKPYIVTRTKDLREVFPPTRFTWVD